MLWYFFSFFFGPLIQMRARIIISPSSHPQSSVSVLSPLHISKVAQWYSLPSLYFSPLFLHSGSLFSASAAIGAGRILNAHTFMTNCLQTSQMLHNKTRERKIEREREKGKSRDMIKTRCFFSSSSSTEKNWSVCVSSWLSSSTLGR